MGFLPFDPDLEIVKAYRHLPHWEQSGRTLYVTFRLADSIPKKKRDLLSVERKLWLQNHPDPLGPEEKKEYQERFLDRIERWSDQGYGCCCLADATIRQLMEQALTFFDQKRYDLHDYVIMPNHVHLLVTPRSPYSLGKLLHSWKSFSSNQINRELGRRGTLWMDERFDHIVRSSEHLQWYRRYIAENPAKARLSDGNYSLYQSFDARDEHECAE